jgi:predicted ATPase
MQKLPFVGREAEIKTLTDVLVRGAQGQGSMVFIEGHAGMGKSILLKALQEQVRQHPTLQHTPVGFAYGYCYEDTGAQNAYQPLIEILQTLTEQTSKQRSIANLIISIIKETAPDWIQMIPGIGPAIGASVKTAALTGHWLFGVDDDKRAALPEAISTQYINTILKVVARYKPLVLVIEDAHWIDNASCQLLTRLAQRMVDYPLVIIVNCRPEYLHAQHPLQRLRREMVMKNLAQEISLAGLTAEHVRRYIQIRYGAPLNPDLAEWLIHLCKGHPLFVTQYLSFLEQQGIIHRIKDTYILDGSIINQANEWHLGGALTNVAIPDSVEALIDQRIERLVEEDREILQLGAVQGEQFMSLVLASMLEKGERYILPRLRKIVEEHGIVSFYTGEEWATKRSEIYIFEHNLMQQAFYRKLSPRECVLYHHSIAEILERMLKEQASSSRKLILEIAHHYALGGEPLLAARYYYHAAHSCFLDGAFDETAKLCQEALTYVRTLAEGIVEHDQLRAEAIQLLLVATEFWWRGKVELQGDLSLNTLAEEAEAAASRLGDRRLLVQVKYIKGRLLITTAGLDAGVAAYQEALAIARAANDVIGEFLILSELGHRMVGKDIVSGLAMMYQADALHTKLLKESQADISSSALWRYFYRLQATIGVNEFDRGNYDEAGVRLLNSTNGLKKLKMHDDLTVVFNFLGQLYTAMGRFEDAETVLREAIDLPKDRKEPLAWRGCNLGLLGKLYLEWGRITDAAGPLQDGWEETLATWNADLAPLVANYRAELLMHPAYIRRDLIEAERQIIATLEETMRTGFHRSTVGALLLRSKLALMERHTDAAADYSTQAVEYLQRMGMVLPALRTEEVLFAHYQALQAIGRANEARIYLDQAYQLIQEKAGTINNEAHRQLFFERVPINSAILSSIQSLVPVDGAA